MVTRVPDSEFLSKGNGEKWLNNIAVVGQSTWYIIFVSNIARHSIFVRTLQAV